MSCLWLLSHYSQNVKYLWEPIWFSRFSFFFFSFLDTASGWPWIRIFLDLASWALGSQVFISTCGLRLKSVRHWIHLLYTICLPQRWPLLNTCDVLMCTFQPRPQEVSAIDIITVSQGWKLRHRRPSTLWDTVREWGWLWTWAIWFQSYTLDHKKTNFFYTKQVA